jgi:hypothetical protein
LQKIACGYFYETLHRLPPAKSVIFAGYASE